MASLALALCILLGFLAMVGCSDDPVDPGEACTASVSTNIIISNPLVPQPGDTTMLTVQSTGSGCGSWPSYSWEASGGELLKDEGITVSWVAPDDPGLYSISCRGSIESSRDTASATVMVRYFEPIVMDRIVTYNPFFVEGELYFLGEADIDEGIHVPPDDGDFLGYHVFKRETSGDLTLVSNIGGDYGGGYEFWFPLSRFFFVCSMYTTYFPTLGQNRMNVWQFALSPFAETENRSADDGGPILARKNQHRYPYASDNGHIVWEYHKPGNKADGTRDLFNIVFQKRIANAGVWETVTESHDSVITEPSPGLFVTTHRYYNNIRPTMSRLADRIVYFVDTTGVYEPCIIPIVNNNPVIGERRAIMVDEEMGIFEQAGATGVGRGTVFQWNPNRDILGFISNGRIFFFDSSTETVARIDELSNVVEFAWSPSGDHLAVINDEGLYIANLAGGVEGAPVFIKESANDDLIGVGWSQDEVEPRLGFRVVRKGQTSRDAWSALIIADLNSGQWAYASPKVPWSGSNEYEVDYTWKRVMFEDDNTGVYVPMPIADEVNYPDRRVMIFHSFEQ
jgi:hypothetical protein